MKKSDNDLASVERRNFLKLAGTGSFTAALVAGAGGMLVVRTSRRTNRRRGAGAGTGR